MQKEQVIIIGSGPAGLTAAIYAARANLNPLIIAGNALGGQIATTSEVENFPGFDSILGPDLVQQMQAQAEKFGTRFEYDEVTEVDFRPGQPLRLKTYSNEYEAESVIITTGASAKKLDIPGETELVGRGVSYCATCDGFFFKGKDVLVIGGGDSALQEALFLTKFASRVRVVHRRDQFRAGDFLQKKASENDKIQFVFDTVLERIDGEQGKVASVQARNLKTDTVARLETDGVFVFVGHFPNSNLFKGQLEMDAQGFLTVDRHLMTNVPGVFAAGEIMDPIFKQAISSAGQGCMAAIAAERWLESREERESAGA